MAQRRPIASHPVFAPLVALWFAALLGLGVAVLPPEIVDRALADAGLGSLGPAGPLIASGAAALLGAVAGWVFARMLARRTTSDPRPVYSEPEPEFAEPVPAERRRRPLSIREELTEDFAEEARSEDAPAPDIAGASDLAEISGPDEADVESPPHALETSGDVLILSPQPVHPPQPAPDLEALLAQFDTALAAFRSEDEPRQTASANTDLDPVHAFVARQTGTPAPSPLGGLVPDHQAELRAALDKLARARRPDD